MSFHTLASPFVLPFLSLPSYVCPLFSRHTCTIFLHTTPWLPGALICHTSASQPASQPSIHPSIQQIFVYYYLLGTELGAGDREMEEMNESL